MQVWNMQHAARWKYRTQKWLKKSSSVHHPTTFSGYIFATNAHISNRKKSLLNTNISPMSSQCSELRTTSSWDPLASLGHPSKFQPVSRLDSVTALHSSSGRQPNFVALNRGRHLYSAGWPSCLALAHILVHPILAWTKHRWRPLFHATVWLTLTTWLPCSNAAKLVNRSQPLVARSSPYCGEMWRTCWCLTSFFSDCRYVP